MKRAMWAFIFVGAGGAGLLLSLLSTLRDATWFNVLGIVVNLLTMLVNYDVGVKAMRAIREEAA